MLELFHRTCSEIGVASARSAAFWPSGSVSPGVELMFMAAAVSAWRLTRLDERNE